MKKGLGFTLIELLIASALSVIVIGGLMTIYISIKTNNNLQQKLMELQESGRFSIYILNQQIRLAGFVGCNDNINPVNQDQAIMGYSSSSLPKELQDQVIAGTDAVVINSCVASMMAYFIGDTHRKNSQGQSVLALFQKPLNADRVELVQGVEQMQILYGLNNDINGLTYYPALQINDWQQVRSVKLFLIINSVEPASKNLLLHKPWSTYITLRERTDGS